MVPPLEEWEVSEVPPLGIREDTSDDDSEAEGAAPIARKRGTNDSQSNIAFPGLNPPVVGEHRDRVDGSNKRQLK